MKKRRVVYLANNIHKDLKHQAVTEGITMSALLDKAIDWYLVGKGARK